MAEPDRAPPPGDLDVGLLMADIRAVVLTGIGLGVLVGGLGGRLAMLVLRLTSDDSVRGLVSDDGFEIGQVTLGDTYGLCMVGAAFGLIGAALHRLVKPWLIGPMWFRHVTTALGAGAVIGSMIVNPDGVDFTRLTPTWLAIALFVAIPALFGAAVGPMLAACTRPDAWINVGRRRLVLPIVAIALFPFTIIVVGFIAVFMTFSAEFRSRPAVMSLYENLVIRLAVRAAFLALAVGGLMALIGDVNDLS